MTGSSVSLPGYRGLRGEVLVALKKAQPLTAKELGARFGVTTNALRRHLKELETQGMVRYTREVHGVGGPVFAYSLTELGEHIFPHGYDAALNEVLGMVRQSYGSDAIVELFRKRWQALAEQAKPELAQLPMNERAHRLAELLSSLGYMAEATDEGGSLLREYNCAIRSVVVRFPEICVAEEHFIEEVLGAQVKRRAHIAAGANCCEYCIHTPESSSAEGDAPEQITRNTTRPKPPTPALQETT